MSNEHCIEKYKFNKMTAERQRQIASMGGKASQDAIKRRKTLREELEIMLELITKDNDGKDVTVQNSITGALLRKAKSGDVRAYEVIRDTIGQMPVVKQEIKEITTVDVDVEE